jgi:hypothetical protein
MKLSLKQSVAKRLVWSRQGSRIAPFCSLCQKHIPDDAVPTMMWNGEGACIHLCDACVETSLEVTR